MPIIPKTLRGVRIKEPPTVRTPLSSLELEQELTRRSARTELIGRVEETSRTTGTDFATSAKTLGIDENLAGVLTSEKDINVMQKNLGTTIESILKLNEASRIAAPEAEIIQQTGTLLDPSRIPFREAGAKPETFTFRLSEEDTIKGSVGVISSVREMRSTLQRIKAGADPFGEATTTFLTRMLDDSVNKVDESVAEFRKQNLAMGRTVRRRQFPIPEDVIQSLQEWGRIVDGLPRMKIRLPLYDAIADKLGRWKELTPEEMSQLGAELIDVYRLNLFATSSFSLDLLGDMAEMAVQVEVGAVKDLVRLVKGNPEFPSLQGHFRVFREKRSLPSQVVEGLGRTAFGEPIIGAQGGFGGVKGTFLSRTTPLRKAIDYGVGTPLYLKGLADQGFKLWGASASLWEDALVQARQLNLGPAARIKFFDEFWAKPPDISIAKAIREGNKAGFNRPMQAWQKRIAKSSLVKLFVDAFPTWGFQFTKWAAEMLGYNPDLYRAFKAGGASAEDIAGYLARTATGVGGLYLLNEVLFDHIDFNTMEYVHPDGNRSRLSGREPLTTALFMLATIKLDKDKATGALSNVSIPGAKALVGEGGLLGGIITQAARASARADLGDPRGLQKNLQDMFNRAIPGQALLAAIKTIFDPVVRRGIGANLPGVSLLKEPVIDPATGEPLAPKQQIPILPSGDEGGIIGPVIPTIAGTPIPGAKRILDPVTQLLSNMGLLIRRGPRTAIAGFPEGEVPENITVEFEREFGKIRNQLLLPIANMVKANPNMLKNEAVFESLRKSIQQLDANAARQARLIIDARAGKPKPGRQPTLKERRGPVR